VLVEAPTISRLASRFSSQRAAAKERIPACMVRLKNGQAGVPPLFILHPVGGQVYIYRDLAVRLGERIPIWGIKAEGADDAGTLEGLARRYMAAIRAVQPHGPYRLGGASFGGTLALEIAQQLRDAGETTEMLVMIDAPAPIHTPHADLDDCEVLCYLLGLRDLDEELVAHLRSLTVEQRLRHFKEAGGEAGRRAAALSPDELRGFLRLWKINLRALQEYQPRPYPGPAVFFRATEEDGFNRNDYHLGWTDLIPGMEVYEIEGTHIEVNLPPRVDGIAQVLLPLLEGIGADPLVIRGVAS